MILDIKTSSNELFLTELGPGEGLAEGPTRGGHVVGDEGAAVASGDLEGEGLAVEVGVALPILPPVPRHRLPPGSRPFDRDRVDVAGASDIGDEH